MKKILIIFLLIGVFLVSSCQQSQPSDKNEIEGTASSKESCEIEGGRWIQYPEEYPKSGGRCVTQDRETCEEKGGKWYDQYGENREICILLFMDAGKTCTSSDACEGLCVTNTISKLGKEGICEKSTDRQGCYNPIENDKFECLLDDILVQCDSQRWDSMCDKLEGDLFFK